MITSFSKITTKIKRSITTMSNSITECPFLSEKVAQFGTKQQCLKRKISSSRTIMKNRTDIALWSLIDIRI